MVLLVKQTMQAKDMFLKNEKYLNFFYLIFFLFLSYKAHSDTNIKAKVLDYLKSLNNFSGSFIQSDGISLSEGKVYIGNERVRAEYLFPTKILIILDEDKAMYYNYELEEEEFFNPKKTNAWFFYDIFRDQYFFKNSKIKIKDGELILERSGFNEEQEKYLIKVSFEKNPLILRKIEVFMNEDFIQLSLSNHNYNEEFDSKFFKLINPSFFD